MTTQLVSGELAGAAMGGLTFPICLDRGVARDAGVPGLTPDGRGSAEPTPCSAVDTWGARKSRGASQSRLRPGLCAP